VVGRVGTYGPIQGTKYKRQGPSSRILTRVGSRKRGMTGYAPPKDRSVVSDCMKEGLGGETLTRRIKKPQDTGDAYMQS
jgi:hypothetical protein